MIMDSRSGRGAKEQLDDVETVQDLTRPEHLLVWAMRAIALGHEDCPTVVRTFRHACGTHGDETLQTYVIFIRYLALSSRRRLQVHVPGCPCVGTDEAAALAIIAAALSKARCRAGGETGLRTALLDLTEAGPDETLVFVAQGLARLLDASGLAVPDRSISPRAQWRQPEAAPTRLLN